MAVIFFNMLLMLDSTTTRFNYNSSFMALKYGRRECLLNLASATCLKITTILIIDGRMRYILLTWNEKKSNNNSSLTMKVKKVLLALFVT